ncbi:unnamed protein product [Sphagnum troendelagicum]|uniref:Uncharacterized protein n=1 Tax=Sphagnum troendelagicum TaxID=128251 RepID=A0ABP0TIN0_9BRYO
MSEKERQLQFMKELEEDWSPPQASPNMSTRGSRSVSPVEIKFMDLEASNKSHKLNGKRRMSEIRRASKLENEQNRSTKSISRHISLVPEARKCLDNASISQKLDWIGLQMRVPEYLENMRGVSREAMQNAATASSSSIQHGRRNSLVMNSFDGSAPITLEHQLASKSNMLSLEKRQSLSMMAFPANAKQWLLQSLRLQDSELQKLFNKMESVPQLIETYHLKELRAEWEELDMRDVNLPPGVGMLMKDQALLERLKNLLTRFIEIEEANQYKAYEESLKQSETTTISDTESELPSEILLPEDTHGSPTPPSRNSVHFEVGENMLPLYGKGVSLCSLCSQLKPRKMPKDSLYLSRSPSPSPQIWSPLPSFIPIEDYVVHRSIVQPGKREDVQLLEEWLKHVTQRTKCEDSDGHIADIDCSFILHSIAFLEVVRQVMVHVEPKLSGIDKELLQLREQIDMDKEYIATISAEFESYTQRIKISEVQIKEKDTQFARFHRCRLCLAENLTPRSREKFVKRTTTKRFSGANTKAEVQEDQSPEELLQASLAAQESHTSEEGASKLGLDQIEGEKTKESKGHPGVEGDAMGGDIESMHEIVALPGEIIPGTAGLESTKKISLAFQHKDGLHRDMPVQTLEDSTQKHPFFEILQRPATAPPRMDTRGMEVFVPLTKEENAIFQKQKLERKLASELEGTSDDGEDIGGTEQEIKNLAASTIELLERSHFDLGLATKIRVLLSRLRQVTKVGVQGAAVGDDEEQDPEASEIAVDEEDSSVASKKKGKKGWGKMRKGLDPARRRSSQLDDLMPQMPSKEPDFDFKERWSQADWTKPKDLPFVPLAFGKLMKISPPPKLVKSFTEHQLSKLIQEIYESKIVADAVDDSVDNERQSACEFVYDFMLNSYGLKGIAESAVHGIFKKIKQLMVNKGIEKYHKLRIFQRFCGYDLAKSYPEQVLYMYLKVMQTATSRPGVVIASDLDDGINFINCGQIEHLLDEPNLVAHFNGSREVAADFLNNFAASHSTLEKSSPEVHEWNITFV